MRLLDLYCGAGGSAVGYARAGFDFIVGVDSVQQARYPFHFVQDDALAYLQAHWPEFDAVHASPPCQQYSKAKVIRGNAHVDLVVPTRAALRACGLPYVIENVRGADLIEPVQLVGTMFGLRTMRPRLFECSFDVPLLLAPPPAARHAKMGRRARADEYIHAVGHGYVDELQEALGIDWMNRNELAQAIPPAYTQLLGALLLAEAQRTR